MTISSATSSALSRFQGNAIIPATGSQKSSTAGIVASTIDRMSFSPESIATLEVMAAEEMLASLNDNQGSSRSDFASLLSGTSASTDSSTNDLAALLGSTSRSNGTHALASRHVGSAHIADVAAFVGTGSNGTASSSSLANLLAGSGSGRQDLATLLGMSTSGSSATSKELSTLLVLSPSTSTTRH